MAILVFLNAWLVTRLCFTFRDRALTVPQWLLLGMIQLLLTGLLNPGLATLALAGSVILSVILSEVLTPPERLNEGRLVGGALVLLVAFTLHWQGAATLWLVADSQLSALRPILIGLFGFLLVANETNLAIRTLLHRFQMEPTSSAAGESRTVDAREYNAGRVIGMLERWLIYLVLVLAQNYSVIALVLAAKGFARFRQMDQREFAEYVLIGTLASMLLTVGIGQLVLYFL